MAHKSWTYSVIKLDFLQTSMEKGTATTVKWLDTLDNNKKKKPVCYQGVVDQELTGSQKKKKEWPRCSWWELKMSFWEGRINCVRV